MASRCCRWARRLCFPPRPPPPPPVTFVIGAGVRVTESLNVRNAPAIPSTILGVQPAGATATILDGPVTASGGVWGRLDYTTGPDGWSAQVGLAVSAPPPALPRSMPR